MSVASRFFVHAIRPIEINDTQKKSELVACGSDYDSVLNPLILDEAKEDLARDYSDVVAQLQVSVAKGTHNRESLLALYIQSIRPENTPNLNSTYANLVHGTEDFFANLIPYTQNASGVPQFLENFDEQLLRLLIEAIARLASIGQISLSFGCEVDSRLALV